MLPTEISPAPTSVPKSYESFPEQPQGYPDEPTARVVELYEGDAKITLATLEDNAIDCVVTSPPYYGQRDYGEKGQIGQEEKPSEYITRLVDVFDEVKRVLKPSGSLWVNIGDTYWSGKGQARQIDEKRGFSRFLRPQDKKGKDPWCVPKQLLLLPHRFAIAMQEDGWIVRGDNVWRKQAPLPDPARDRCAIIHEYIFHFVQKRRYYFSMQAVAVPSNGKRRTKPPASVWDVTTASTNKNHSAVFPHELVRLPILATCPQDGVLLDPFCGTATALSVALTENIASKAIGIDISPASIAEARELLSSLPNTTINYAKSGSSKRLS